MLSWTVGDVVIRRVVELEIPVAYQEKRPLIAGARPEALAAMTWLYPHFVTPEGHLMSAVHALLVEAPGVRLVVDTCIGNDKPRRMTAGHPLNTPFLSSLEAAGWSRESVDAVVCTHLHVDHVGWNTLLEDGHWRPTFPRARYLFGKREFEYWSQHEQAEARAILGDSVQPIFDAGLAQLVETDHRISPELRLLPTPGHTPGHVSVLIESRGATALITGDTLHHPCQFGRPEWHTAFDEDVSQARATRLALLEEFADRPVLVIGTHFAAPTAGHIQRDGAAFRFVVD
jgi:glyoxylase-like metal-dependent hydrolase (beta-lactamase superfamily II)